MIRDLLPRLLAALAEGLKGHYLLLAIVLIGYQLIRRVIRYYSSPFRHQGIPGPFLAGFSCWYRVFYADVRRNWHAKLVELHDEYGPVVWIAPDEVSISDPLLRGSIYPFADNRKEESFFAKSKSFETGLFNDDFNFVFETDAAKARLGKYALSHPYSEKGLTKLENNFDEAVEGFTQGFTEHVANSGMVHNFSPWGHYFMFDVATSLMANYSNGLCRAGKDLGGAIGALRLIFNVVGSLVPIPFALQTTTRYIRKCILNSQLEHLFSWAMHYDKGESHKVRRINEVADDSPNHLMAKFREGEKKMRRLFVHGNWTEAITNNVFFIYAGSMVASNALPLVVRHIYSSPEALAKIRVELASVNGHVKIANMIHRHDEACDLPYLEAAILEALRLSPSFGLSLGRIVPATGCQLNDYFIPPGYIVSMSGWAVNIDKNYFGEDAKEFKPERWIGNHPTELAKDGSGLPRTMRNYLEAGWFTFGAGSRVCIGRHLSMIAFTKFVADMVRHFDIEVVKEPSIWYGLIQHTEDMMIKAKVRDDTGHSTGGLGGYCGR